jgi:hypothetical protein
MHSGDVLELVWPATVTLTSLGPTTWGEAAHCTTPSSPLERWAASQALPPTCTATSIWAGVHLPLTESTNRPKLRPGCVGWVARWYVRKEQRREGAAGVESVRGSGWVARWQRGTHEVCVCNGCMHWWRGIPGANGAAASRAEARGGVHHRRGHPPTTRSVRAVLPSMSSGEGSKATMAGGSYENDHTLDSRVGRALPSNTSTVSDRFCSTQ